MILKLSKITNLIFILSISFIFPLLVFLKKPGYNPCSLSEIMIFLIIIFYIFKLLIILNKKTIPSIPIQYKFILLLYFFFQVILLFGSDSYIAAINSILLHDKYIFLSILVFYFIDKRNENTLIFSIVLVAIAAVYLALLKLLQDPSQLLNLFGIGGYHRTSSVFPNSNVFGVYMLVIIFMELYLYELFKQKKQKVFFVFFVFLPTFLSLLLTFSRRSWGLFLVGILIYFLLKQGNKILFLISSILMIVLLFNFIDFESIINRFLLIFDNNYASNHERIEAFTLQYKVFENNLFTIFGGNGIGMFGPSSIFTNSGQWSQIDNYYMQLLLEFGLIGLCLYLIIFFIVVSYSIKLLRKLKCNKQEYNKILIYLIIVSSLYVSAIVGSTPISFPLNTFQWIFIGLILKNYIELKKVINV